MKVSVITQHTVFNYGSVLQTYATQKLFEQLGCDVVFADFWRESNLPQTRARKAMNRNPKLKKLKPVWESFPVLERMAQRWMAAYLRKSQRHLDAFLGEHIHLTRRYLSLEELMADPPQADLYVTGSDQVWNSDHNDGVEGAYFLEYAPEGKPRTSLAASIGKTEFSPEEGRTVAEYLKKYSAVSVREASAAALLKTWGIQARTVLDPTLILDRQWWRELADYGKCPSKPYLLIYQLNRNREMDSYAQRLAEQQGWEILRIGYFRSDKKRVGSCVYCPTVPEFLGLFDRAACCLTDSFHATAFSLNFGIDFISVRPPRFAARIEDILERTGTADRLLEDYGDMEIQSRPIHKDKVSARLAAERKESWEFLREMVMNNNRE